MSDRRGGWRRGVRPGLVGALVVAVLVLMALPRYPEIGVVEARVTFLGLVVGTFGSIVLLYGIGAVEPAERSRDFNPFILGLVTVALVLLAITEC